MSNLTLTKPETVISQPAAKVAIIGTALALAFLASLHVLSSEYDPSFHMISEYANGQYGWVLSLMFLTWGISTGLLAYALRNQMASGAGKAGIALLFLAGFGQAMAAIFNIRLQPFHDLCGYLSIPSFAIAAMLISVQLSRTTEWKESKKVLLWMANLTWISIVLFIVTFALMLVTFMQSGAKVDPNVTVMVLPHGVVGLVGYTNRLGVVANCLWIIVVAWLALKVHRIKSYRQ